MIQYSNGVLINRTFTPATRADLCNAMTLAMSDAGWTTISGVPGSGSDVTMETAAPVLGAGIRCRVTDPGSGNCVQTTIKNAAGTITSSTSFVLPGNPMRVVANKYTVYAFWSGTSSTILADMRHVVMAGTLWTPAFLNLQVTDPIGWMLFNGITDIESSSSRHTWRVNLRTGVNEAYYGIYQASGVGGNPNLQSDMSLCPFQGGTNNSDKGYRWIDNTLMIYEPFVQWPTGSSTANEGKIKGQLYDAIIVTGTPIISESTIQFDGHTWISITDQGVVTATRAATGALYVAIT